MKILITGAKGFLGKAIVNQLRRNHQVFATGRDVLNILNKEDSFCYIKKTNPNIIIHLAGIPSPNACERNKELAYNVNVLGTFNIVKIAQRFKIKVIYISTNYVFNGINNTKEGYTIDDIPNPLNYYGYTKLRGEEIIKTLSKYTIVRLPLLVGYNYFVTNILENKNPIELDDTIIRHPITIYQVSKFIEDEALNNSGILHHCSKYGHTKFELAKLISKIFKISNDKIRPTYVNKINRNFKLKTSYKFNSLKNGLHIMKEYYGDIK